MSPSVDYSFEQTTHLLDALVKDPTEAMSEELVRARTVVRDLGNEAHSFEPGVYLGSVVKRALDNHK